MPVVEQVRSTALTRLRLYARAGRLDRAGRTGTSRGKRQDKHRADESGQFAMVPLFFAALLFLAGIVAARALYLRPGYLLVGLMLLGAVTAAAVLRAPRICWLPLACLWLLLGWWSAEMEKAPAVSPEVTILADGLLRTVEGTVIEAGPEREPATEPSQLEMNQPDSDGVTEAADTAHSEPAGNRSTQRVDLRLSSAEVVTDESDRMDQMPPNADARVRLTVMWPGTQPSGITCGQRVRAVVRLLPPEVYHDPGVWSRAAFLEQQQISAAGSVDAARQDQGQARLEILKASQSFQPSCSLNSWRNAASNRLSALPWVTRRLPRPLRATPEDAAMLTALLTGDRTWLTRGIRMGFERTGSFHLIVVSGLHLAILAGCISGLARRLRMGRWPATIVTILTTLAYALFTGFAVPAQRSFWMIAVYLVSRALFRDRSPLNAIGFATLCLAAVSPRSVFDASLQMTVISVAAIAGIAVPLLERTLATWIKATRNLDAVSLDPRLPSRVAQLRVTLRMVARRLEPAANRWTAWRAMPSLIRAVLRGGELFFVTLVVELALALPMAVYFHRITVYSLPVNLFILPLLGLLVPAAMGMLLVLTLLPSLASAPAAITLGLLHLSLWVVRGLGALAASDVRVPAPGELRTVLAFAALVLALLLARVPIAWARPAQRRLAFVALMLMAALALWPGKVDHPAGAMLFEAIDVGQGDSLLLISPEGKTLLVDAGGVGFPSRSLRQGAAPDYGGFDVGEEVASEVLWSRGIRRLDAVALTHAHHDHMGGMAAILRNFQPRVLWVGNNPAVAAYRDLMAAAARERVPVRELYRGDQLSLGSVTLRVLAPDRNYQPGPEPRNDDSLVLQARYRSSTVLLEGDAEAPEEHGMLAEAGLESTVLKVGHHGSLTSTRPDFLARVKPAWAMISCGRRNRFGHPRGEILAELQAAHVKTFRTDIDGASCLLLDGQTVTAQPMCREDRQGLIH